MKLAPGERIGPYEIVDPIGAGGMGEVYRARDSSLQRFIALKVLPEPFAADPERLARFEREARTLALLNHPHIAQIYGLERRASQPGTAAVLVMEYVDGEDLTREIARGPIAVEVATRIARQIAEALEAAHEQGIVHRDLKPANIKLRPARSRCSTSEPRRQLASRRARGPVATRGRAGASAVVRRRQHTFCDQTSNSFDPRFSPDGRWLACAFVERNRPEIYVALADGMMVAVDPSLALPVPTLLFAIEGAEPNLSDYRDSERWFDYDVTPDGQRFLIRQPTRDARRTGNLRVVIGWNSGLD